MGKCSLKNIMIKKIISINILFFFSFQTILTAQPAQILSSKKTSSTMQVESFFTTDSNINQIKTELRFIREMLTREDKIPSFITINAKLDDCHETYGRILNLKKSPRKNRDESITVELEVLGRESDSELWGKINDTFNDRDNVYEYDPKKNVILVTFRTKKASKNIRRKSIKEQENKEKFITSFDGAKIAYEVTGTGKEIIVLIHYWGGNRKMWSRFLNVILKKTFFKKYTVLTLDLRGFGSSELKGKDWKKNKKYIENSFGTHRFLRSLYVKYCARDIKEILKKEKFLNKRDFKGVNLMGHSLGGMVAMQFALEFPGFTKSLALINTSSDPIHTFSPMTFIPGSTWLVKAFLKAIANITEGVLFLYEDFFSIQRKGLEKISETIKNVFYSGDYKILHSAFNLLPIPKRMSGQYMKYIVHMSEEISRLHSDLFEDKVPENIERIGNDLKSRVFGTLKNTAAFSWFLESIVLNGEDREVVEEIVEAFEKLSFYVLIHTFFAISFINFPKDVLGKHIKCPVLVVRGMKDLVTGRKSEWAQSIHGLRRLAILKGKHMGPQEYPSDLADIIGWFLRIAEEGGDVDTPLSMDQKTENEILSGKSIEINGSRAKQVVKKIEEGIYTRAEIGRGMEDVRRSLIALMKEIDTTVSREISSTLRAKSLMGYLSSTKESLGKGDSYLYVKDGRLIGFLNLIVKKSFLGKYTVEGRLAVLPEEQDAGAGYALLDHAITASRKIYSQFSGFELILFPDERSFFNQYFKKRTKNEKGDLPFYIKYREINRKGLPSKVVFDVEIFEYSFEDKLQFSKEIIKGTDKRAKLLLNAVVGALGSDKNKNIPVDIIVDLSLVSSDDCREDMNAWAHLILNCRDLKNVNFVFRDPHNFDIFSIDDCLDGEACNLETIPTKDKAIQYLREAIEAQAERYGLDEDILQEILNRSIYEDRRDNAIVIPIISKAILSSAAREELKLKPNVFPVAMDGITFIKGKGTALRNYQAALAVSLTKAALVMAKNNGEKDFYNMIKEILPRIKALYSVFKNIEIDEAVLMYMLDNNPVQRLRIAIELSIPEISRMPYDDLPVLHEAIEDCLDDA